MHAHTYPPPDGVSSQRLNVGWPAGTAVKRDRVVSFVLLLGCWIEALSVRSDHDRAAGYRIRRVTVVLEEMVVAPGQTQTLATKDASLQPAAAPLLPCGQAEVASVMVDDVHQAWST